MESRRRKEELQTLCLDYIPKLRTFVDLNYSGLGDDCDDVVQGILEKLVRRYDSFNPHFSKATWIYAIARNHCIDLLRRQSRTKFRIETLENPDDTQSLHPGPEEAVMDKNDRNRMREMIRRLPDRERQILYLSSYEGMSYREISRVMNIPEGTAKYLKQRAKTAIVEMWEEDS